MTVVLPPATVRQTALAEPVDPAVRVTWRLAVPSPLFTLNCGLVHWMTPGPSSSVIVSVCCVVAHAPPENPVGLPNARITVSLVSVAPSRTTDTLQFLVVSPGLKVNTCVLKEKSTPPLVADPVPVFEH